ncbi:MAG: hypothetical protein KF724_07105 [Phycisphaeraceae bacterium]|nr:hypothetical protein [Phycisphaeraceae bacterium]
MDTPPPLAHQPLAAGRALRPHERPRTSRLALLALGMNVPCFLPPFPLLAVLMGGIAYWRVRKNADLGGAALAIAAMLLGIVLTVISTSTWWSFVRITSQGPIDAIRAAQAGDGEAFRALFAGDPAELSNDEVSRFAAALRERYGAIIDGRIQRTTKEIPRQGDVWSVPFELRFERGQVPATAAFTIRDPHTGRSTLALWAIVIEDPKDGDLRVPEQSRTLSTP